MVGSATPKEIAEVARGERREREERTWWGWSRGRTGSDPGGEKGGRNLRVDPYDPQLPWGDIHIVA